MARKPKLEDDFLLLTNRPNMDEPYRDFGIEMTPQRALDIAAQLIKTASDCLKTGLPINNMVRCRYASADLPVLATEMLRITVWPGGELVTERKSK